MAVARRVGTRKTRKTRKSAHPSASSGRTDLLLSDKTNMTEYQAQQAKRQTHNYAISMLLKATNIGLNAALKTFGQ